MYPNLRIIRMKINSKLKSQKSKLQLKSESFNYLIVIASYKASVRSNLFSYFVIARSGATKQSLADFLIAILEISSTCGHRPEVSGRCPKY